MAKCYQKVFVFLSPLIDKVWVKSISYSQWTTKKGSKTWAWFEASWNTKQIRHIYAHKINQTIKDPMDTVGNSTFLVYFFNSSESAVRNPFFWCPWVFFTIVLIPNPLVWFKDGTWVWGSGIPLLLQQNIANTDRIGMDVHPNPLKWHDPSHMNSWP
jgi:hypothetical protein